MKMSSEYGAGLRGFSTNGQALNPSKTPIITTTSSSIEYSVQRSSVPAQFAPPPPPLHTSMPNSMKFYSYPLSNGEVIHDQHTIQQTLPSISVQPATKSTVATMMPVSSSNQHAHSLLGQRNPPIASIHPTRVVGDTCASEESAEVGDDRQAALDSLLAT